MISTVKYIGNMAKLHKRHKSTIQLESIIMEALLECLKVSHIKDCNYTRASGRIVNNPHYWEQGEFVSLDYIDQYDNIVYTVTQPGTMPTDSNHTIGVAFHYSEYKPFHDKWIKLLNRAKNLEELVG